MNNLNILILAAGLGKRMNSDLPKACVKTREKSLIGHVLTECQKLNPDKIIVVTGHKKELLEKEVDQTASELGMKNISFAFQDKQLGTGHAVQCALLELKKLSGDVLILYGDVPLISSQTLEKLIKSKETLKSQVNLITFIAGNPTGYGRIFREENQITKIIEEKDCTGIESIIDEVNSGIYLCDLNFLEESIGQLKNDNAQKEYYLTDIIKIAASKRIKIGSVILHSEEEVLGVNTTYELSRVNRALQQRKIKEYMQNGVIFEDINSFYADSTVRIDKGVKIGPNVQLYGDTVIKEDVVLEGTAYLNNVKIEEGATIKFSVKAENSKIGKNCKIGPFAHLRPETVLEEGVKIGNFVETKKVHLKENVSVSHLTYLGDTAIGARTNIGAGTITCNYDGVNKHKTEIGEDVFVGSNSSLVAPLKIGAGVTIGAGSVITKSVKDGSLALTRAEMRVKEGYKRPEAKKS